MLSVLLLLGSPKELILFLLIIGFHPKNIVQLLYDKVYPLHGLPLQIISDRGVQYLAKLFQE